MRVTGYNPRPWVLRILSRFPEACGRRSTRSLSVTRFPMSTTLLTMLGTCIASISNAPEGGPEKSSFSG